MKLIEMNLYEINVFQLMSDDSIRDMIACIFFRTVVESGIALYAKRDSSPVYISDSFTSQIFSNE